MMWLYNITRNTVLRNTIIITNNEKEEIKWKIEISLLTFAYNNFNFNSQLVQKYL